MANVNLGSYNLTQLGSQNKHAFMKKKQAFKISVEIC